MSKSIGTTLKARGKRYGTFADGAAISQGLQDVMRASPNWDELSADKKEALQIIQHKISRMLNGDPEYKDNWHDIVGYAKLVDDTLSE